MSTHTEDIKFRLATIELLRTAKKHKTYREISRKTKLPITVLSRYVKGHVLPSSERAHDLWEILSDIVGLESEFQRRIKLNKNGFFDNTSIIGDANLLNQAANYALAKFAGKRITKVLTASVDGIPLASIVAYTLGVNLVVAKPTKEVMVTSFLEETFTLRNSGHTITLFTPKKAIKKNDSIVIVDDILRSGDTQSALINLVRKARAEVTGIFILIAIGNSWRKTMNIPTNCQVEIILSI